MKIRCGWLVKTVSPAVAVLVAAAASMGAEATPPPADIAAGVREGFTTSRPCVMLKYEVSYNFLGMQLMRVAHCRVEATEGEWRGAGERPALPACFMTMDVDSIRGRGDGRIFVNNRFVSLLAMPDLDTLYFAKKADEIIRPLLGAPKRAAYLDVYDLRSGELAYRREDHLTGGVITNLAGKASLANQGRNVSNLLKVLSSIYYGKEEMLRPAAGRRIQFNVDGQVLPFVIATEQDRAPVVVFDQRLPCLRVSIRPAPEARGKGGRLTVWAVSFKDLSRLTAAPGVRAVAESTVEWSMVPLTIDYDLVLGYVRCRLVDLQTRPFGPIPGK
jgi:hypothetical protein